MHGDIAAALCLHLLLPSVCEGYSTFAGKQSKPAARIQNANSLQPFAEQASSPSVIHIQSLWQPYSTTASCAAMVAPIVARPHSRPPPPSCHQLLCSSSTSQWPRLLSCIKQDRATTGQLRARGSGLSA